MISGIENFETKLQKALLSCIASLFDMSEDIEIEEIEKNIIRIDDTKFYVITDAEIQEKIAEHNRDAFNDFFEKIEFNGVNEESV